MAISDMIDNQIRELKRHRALAEKLKAEDLKLETRRVVLENEDGLRYDAIRFDAILTIGMHLVEDEEMLKARGLSIPDSIPQIASFKHDELCLMIAQVICETVDEANKDARKPSF